MEKADKIWLDGSFVDWDDAKIHILSHVVHYGTGVFEGMRCYKTKSGPAVFRLKRHVDRMFDSSKIYRMDIPFTREQISDAILETIRVNRLDECYVRPLVFRGFDSLGVNPFTCPVQVAIAVWRWGQYLGEEAVTKGVDVKVSTWNRVAPNTFPAMAKCCANYMNSQLVKMEAITEGYSEGIALDPSGYVSEGSGENVFLVKEKEIFTPPISSSILVGATRDTVITLAREMGYTVREENIPREMLYIVDEVFFTGSAAEITPIKSIDKITIGKGSRGPVTEKLQKAFFAITKGEVEDTRGWLTYVEPKGAAT